MPNLKTMFRTVRSTLLCTGVGMMVLAGATNNAIAADYPTRPIQIVSPYGAGGDSDLTARIWAEFAKKKLGQPVVVVNKTGGGGITGTMYAAKAKPDGYTLFLAQAGPSLIVPQVNKAGFDFDSFDYIARIMVANCAVVTNPDNPWNDLREFAEDAKANPGKRIFASPSATSWLTFAMRNWQTDSGTTLKQVEFQSAAEAATAVLGKHADISFLFPQSYVSMAKAGKMKILAIGSPSDEFPEAKTFEQLGFKGKYFGWGGIAVPKGAPQDVIDKLAAVTKEITEDPEFQKAIHNMGAKHDFTTGTEWMTQLKDQYAEMTRVLTDLGMIKK